MDAVVKLGHKVFTNSPKYNSVVLWRNCQKPVPPFRLHPSNSYIENTSLENDLRQSIIHPLRGVHVLNLPPGAGKSASIRRVCGDLKNTHQIGGVLQVVASENSIQSNMSISSWLHSTIGISTRSQLSTYLEPKKDMLHQKPVVLFIDQFDHIGNHPSSKSFVVSLAEDSVLHKTFVVVLGITSPRLAESVLGWNGKTKIRQVGTDIYNHRWGKDQIEKLIQIIKPGISETDKAAIIELGLLAGTPGFVLEMLNASVINYDRFKSYAELINTWWKETNALH